MLRELHIDRFKSIQGQVLRLGRANLFVGPNGAGKSNALEALGVVAAALARGIDQDSLASRGVRLSTPRLFKSAFKTRPLPNSFHLKAIFDHGYYSCSVRAGEKSSFLEFTTEALFDGTKQVFGRGPRAARVYQSREGKESKLSRLDSTRSLWDAVRPILKVSRRFAAELENFAGFRIYAPQTAVMRGTATDSRPADPLGLTGSGLAQAFSEVLQLRRDPQKKKRVDQILDVVSRPGWADLIKVGTYDPKIVPSQVQTEGLNLYIRDKFMTSQRNYLSPYDASEGTLYLIFVAVLLCHPRAPHSFALDNVDGTLNPKLVRQLTDHIVSVCSGDEEEEGTPDTSRHQAFMTSHHPSALDSFDIFDKDQSIFTMHRSPITESRGESSFFRLEPPPGTTKNDWSVAHRGANLSQLLLDGRIPGALE